MRAVDQLSKSVLESSNGLSKGQTNGRQWRPDGLYARLRQLEQRLSEIESLVSVLRRDVNRIDRKQYREAAPINTPATGGVVRDLNSMLFGGRIDG